MSEKEKLNSLYHKVTKRELFWIAHNWADLMTCDEEGMTLIDKIEEELELVKDWDKPSTLKDDIHVVNELRRKEAQNDIIRGTL